MSPYLSGQINHPASCPGKRAFTLIELVVVIALIAILASLLFPVFARARERARTVSCMSNVAQLGLALHLYAQDYDGHFPPDEETWVAALREYTRNEPVFRCPSAPRQGETDYAYRPGYSVDDPGLTPLLVDGFNRLRILDDMFRHSDTANVFFLNGRVKSVRKDAWRAAGWPLPEPLKTEEPALPWTDGSTGRSGGVPPPTGD